MAYLDESQVEIAAVDYFRELGYEYVHGPKIAPDGEAPERADYRQVALVGRLRDALLRINPDVPQEAVEEAVRKVTRPESPSLVVNNRAFHRMLTDGVDVSWREDGQERHGKVWLIERAPARLDCNEFLVVNQFTVIEEKRNRRPDVVVFVNGLPLPVRSWRSWNRPSASTRTAHSRRRKSSRNSSGWPRTSARRSREGRRWACLMMRSHSTTRWRTTGVPDRSWAMRNPSSWHRSSLAGFGRA